jgi:hypothetical protein
LSDEYDRPSRKDLGSYYLVTLRQAGDPVLSVAVSVLAGDLLVQDGRIHFPKSFGSEFIVIPYWRGHEYPISPERAAMIANEAVGRRVVSLPELLLPPVTDRWAPQYSMWRVVLEGDHGSLDTSYVSWHGEVLRGGRGHSRVHRAEATRTGNTTSEQAHLRIRADVPDRFTHVTRGGR